MSSPVSHLACGFAIYRILVARDPHVAGLPRGTRLATAALFSMVPDLDFVAGWIAQDFPDFHNNVSHSFMFGLVLCLLAAILVSTRWRTIQFRSLWAFTFACYASHITVDYFTHGRGVMLFWPFLHERFSSPVILFTGVHWTKGLWSTDHLWTLGNDAVFALLLVGLTELAARRILKPMKPPATG
jgi:inner membrane protein